MAGTDKIKNLFLKGRIQIKRPTRKPVLKPYTEFKEILIASDKINQIEVINIICTIFKDAKITFLRCRKEKEDNSSFDNYSYHISDFNLTGNIKNEKLKHVLTDSFDLVIDLSPENIIGTYILQKLKQTFMVGKSGLEKSTLYDLIIQNDLTDEDSIYQIKEQIILLTQ